jgi:hypothetical protein
MYERTFIDAQPASTHADKVKTVTIRFADEYMAFSCLRMPPAD